MVRFLGAKLGLIISTKIGNSAGICFSSGCSTTPFFFFIRFTAFLTCSGSIADVFDEGWGGTLNEDAATGLAERGTSVVDESVEAIEDKPVPLSIRGLIVSTDDWVSGSGGLELAALATRPFG